MQGPGLAGGGPPEVCNLTITKTCHQVTYAAVWHFDEGLFCLHKAVVAIPKNRGIHIYLRDVVLLFQSCSQGWEDHNNADFVI